MTTSTDALQSFKMPGTIDTGSESGSSSPRQSHFSSISEPHTPSTERSVLFEGPFHNIWHPNTDFIAVVGGLGYIGSHTCLELLKAGHNIIIIDNLSNSFRSVFDSLCALAEKHFAARCQPAPLLHFYEADYRDDTTIREILTEFIKPSCLEDSGTERNVLKSRIKGVIHFGGYKSVSESIKKPLRYYTNNVAGMIRLCATLDEFNIKTLIFSSSATVYGSLANIGVPIREEYCTHQTETFIDHDGKQKTTLGGCSGLTNPYGRTKWMCEAILSDLAIADPEWTIIALRYFNPVGCDESGLLGEDPRGVPTNLMPVVMRVMTGVDSQLNVFGTDYPTHDGTAVRDFIHVTDLAKGHIAALSAAADGRVPRGFRTYNLGSGSGQSVFDVVNAVEKMSSTKIPLRTVPRREGDVGTCVAMPMRAEIELDWKTEKSLETCCRDTINFLDHRKGSSVSVRF
jgi:UDP-glucose 4-epimerase